MFVFIFWYLSINSLFHRLSISIYILYKSLKIIILLRLLLKTERLRLTIVILIIFTYLKNHEVK